MVMGKDWKNFEVHDLKSLRCFKEKVGGNIYIKGVSLRAQEEVRSI